MVAKLTPINLAEGIIEPFWDPQLSELPQWTIEPGVEHGLQVKQEWCFVTFEWSRKPAGANRPALRMSRQFDVNCADYDTLVVSVMAPEQSILRALVVTDRGEIVYTAPPAPALKKEYAIDLQGAALLKSVSLEIHAAREGVASGWFNWIGLQQSGLLQRHLAQWERFDAQWERYLKPESDEPSFTPCYGILVNRDELEAMRAEHDAFLGRHGDSPFTLAARQAAALTPEKMVHEFVNFWTDTRYCRERDHGKHLLTHGPNAAVAGLLLKDKQLLRLGARYALALAMCGRWDDGMICYFPGGTFEHRCFVQSLCVHEVALLLDLAGECFTDLGRQYLLRRCMEEGLGAINYNTWKHEYIFTCNQLAWFTPGRMLGYVTAEQSTPRVKPYTEIAYQELVESLGYTILPDGGYVEGPTYFRCVGRDAGLSLYYYARARGQAFADVIPEVMKRTAAFGAAIASTDDSADVIPICDARPLIEHETAAVMAAVLPDSQWVSIFNKAVARGGGMPNTVFAYKLARDIPRTAPPPAPLTYLPVMGVLASVRPLGAETVKLLIMGNKAGAGHTHEDKGSFVLEFAGETFAMDPGTCDYAHPLSLELKNGERHNMLIPTGLYERPYPDCPLPADVKPQGHGDRAQFHARIDAAPGWAAYYTRWVRQWDSPSPDVLVIRDEYALAQGSGVAFYWSTQRDVQIQGHTITLSGKRGTVVIEAPADCTVHLDVLPLLDGAPQQRIAIHKGAVSGSLEVRVRLAAQASAQTQPA